ncbi:MAG: alpha-glucan family phosphorylase [Desulfovibrionaceae bacterium]
MQVKQSHITLFEVSWEVCNKVGGIYSVVSSKALQAVDEFGEDFFLLGPDLKNNAGFEETEEHCWDSIRQILANKDLKCRLGRWDIPGRPKVILVDFAKRYTSNQLLYELWASYGVDSLSGGWDYIEPVMFSYTCGEIIAAIHENHIQPTRDASVAQFHEWMCGAGLLAVKKLAPSVGTVFTTHATMLGRALASTGMDIYKQMRSINPQHEAAAHNITAKYSMESIAAREAGIFTTVSQITADEAEAFLGRKPDVITTNGLDMRVIPNFSEDRKTPATQRARLLKAVSPLLRQEMPENTRIFVISGRYEFHNKGVDVFLDAMSGVAQAIKNSDTHVLALCLVMGGHTGVNPAAISGDPNLSDNGMPFLSSHHVWNQANDSIINACRRLGLTNFRDNNVQIIFVPAMLNGADGFLNMTYDEILAASDLGVFPSWYEPWGYTPHESAAFAVPTITTDLSGFGIWARALQDQNATPNGVAVIARRQSTYDETVNALRGLLLKHATMTEDDLLLQRQAARELSLCTSWEKFFPYYLTAYRQALEKSEKHSAKHDSLSRVLTATASTTPFLRTLTAVAELPPSLERLRELARNLWWCWTPEAKQLFFALNPQAWNSTGHNPVLMIEEADPTRLAYISTNPEYLALYKRVLERFDAYMAEGQKNIDADLGPHKPVAYFSTEYGLHESLPIYSGGLGVLSGDHLKSASDLRIPLVAVGLLYKNGYFRQQLDKNGSQVALYPENIFANLPVERTLDKNGTPMEMEIDLPERTLYANIWQVSVGRITLYLMDSDNPKNTAADRKITARLYEADRDYRLRQEILLGMGGVRMLRKLGITVAAYHMNEGHSAFMVIERMRAYMTERGLSFNEAFERVRSNTIFTTHTPVDAGNERFNVEMMERYFSSAANTLGLSWPEFLRLGRVDGAAYTNNFEMTVLALKASTKANGVSRLHGVVSQHMWRDLWKGVPIPEIPIGYVTNGIHVASYVGDPVRSVLDHHLGPDWLAAPPDSPLWKKVPQIPDEELGAAKIQQKEALLEMLRDSIPGFLRKYGLSSHLRKQILPNITPAALIIGFARRFAPYKRATLLFADPDRLERLLNQAGRPLIFVFSGKSHPADQAGIQLIEEVIRYSKEPRFLGRIFFIEDYSLAISRVLAQGCDVWLNNPRRPYEASGTSGQKVPVNGGINLSVSDGWWCEGYNRENGWTIGPVVTTELPCGDQNDYADAESLYTLLEDSVLPLYFDHDAQGMPHRWISMAKRSLQSLTAMYSSHRMLEDYMSSSYIPASKRNTVTHANDYALARHLAQWKQTIPVRFGSVRFENITLSGLNGDTLACGQALNVQVQVHLGELAADELLVQLVIGLTDNSNDFKSPPEIMHLMGKSSATENTLQYSCTYIANKNGRYAYGIRIMPVTKGLSTPLDSGLILWG